MNRSKKQVKAAKARKDWLRLQEEKRKKVEDTSMPDLQKTKDSDSKKEDNLRNTA